MIDKFFETYNVYDVDGLFNVIFGACDDNVCITGKGSPDTYYGKGLLFVLWHLAHDIYPDSMLKVLDQRLISLITPKKGSQGDIRSTSSSYEVEYVYKLTGSRVTVQTLMLAFQGFTKRFADKSTTYWSHTTCAELCDHILTYISEGALTPLTNSEAGSPCCYIAAAILSIDPQSNKITKWTIEFLAQSSST